MAAVTSCENALYEGKATLKRTTLRNSEYHPLAWEGNEMGIKLSLFNS